MCATAESCTAIVPGANVQIVYCGCVFPLKTDSEQIERLFLAATRTMK